MGMFLLWGHHSQMAASPAEARTAFTPAPSPPPAHGPRAHPDPTAGRGAVHLPACLSSTQRPCSPCPGREWSQGAAACPETCPFPALTEPSMSMFFTWFLEIRRRVITGTENYSQIAKCTAVRVCAPVSAQMCACVHVCTCVGAHVCLSRAENRPGGLREVVQGGGQVPPPPPSSGLVPPPPPPAPTALHRPEGPRETRCGPPADVSFPLLESRARCPLRSPERGLLREGGGAGAGSGWSSPRGEWRLWAAVTG